MDLGTVTYGLAPRIPGDPVAIATIYNTASNATLAGSSVIGFIDPANDLDARLAAIGG